MFWWGAFIPVDLDILMATTTALAGLLRSPKTRTPSYIGTVKAKHNVSGCSIHICGI